VATDQNVAAAALPADGSSPAARRSIPWLLVLAIGVLVVDVLAFIMAPPFDPNNAETCAFPVCFINGNIEFPQPVTVIGTPMPEGPMQVGFALGISNTIVTMWIVMAIVLALAIFVGRRLREVPGRLQNAVEWAWEALDGFARSTGGAAAVPHIPLFASFFLLILFCNWSGLVPPVGKLEFLRAPTSDLNVTIGLALVAFSYFEFRGFQAHGIGYLSKFFPVREFRNGIGMGLIGMFVGLIELLLELVKPVTLAMRLFGNIYGGEVALGVITALTIAFVPGLILGLELMLNFVQALIFSILTLMFTLIALESHDSSDHEEHAHTTAQTEAVPAA
jgi:F-type H+-transporting ATPase subunit a